MLKEKRRCMLLNNTPPFFGTPSMGVILWVKVPTEP